MKGGSNVLSGFPTFHVVEETWPERKESIAYYYE